MRHLYVALLALTVASPITARNLDPARPNVLVIYYDDMGWGDMGANIPSELVVPEGSRHLEPGATSLTPHLDALASQGMRFTNGHSADGVCTPSRYALMTGRYCWRTWLKRGVTGGYSPSLMQKQEFTVGKMLQEQGYRTAMVGKWHIGMQFQDSEGNAVKIPKYSAEVLSKNEIDFSRPVLDTPIHTAGFDYFFGTSASLDMPPYAWLETRGERVHLLVDGAVVIDGEVDFSRGRVATNADLDERKNLREEIQAFARDGVIDPSFVFADYLQVQAAKVREVIAERESDGEPFFIYVPMPAPHTPHTVQPKFIGSAGWTYGDYVVQTDYYTGKIIEALGDPSDPNSLAANTVVFVTSDNGPENVAYHSSLEKQHDTNGPYAGRKRDSYEGGTRVPFVVRWPGMAEAGSVTDHLCWQGDIIPTLAEHLGVKLGGQEAPDAESFLPVLQGEPMPKGRRQAIIQHSSRGQFAIVEHTGRWKLIDGTGGGGNKTTSDADNQESLVAGTLRGQPRQLFDLASDPGERNNLLQDPTPESQKIADDLYNLLNLIRGDAEWGTDGNSWPTR
ncbi:MAG: arylsulfatase [Planctomycetota bacterium]